MQDLYRMSLDGQHMWDKKVGGSTVGEKSYTSYSGIKILVCMNRRKVVEGHTTSPCLGLLLARENVLIILHEEVKN